MNISLIYKIAQIGVIQRTKQREGNIETESPKAYAGNKSMPDIENIDRDYLTNLLLREFGGNVLQTPSNQNYANELINP